MKRCSSDARSRGQPWPLPSILEVVSRGKRTEGKPGDSLCSRNARPQKALVGRAHVGNPPGRPLGEKRASLEEASTCGEPAKARKFMYFVYLVS